MAAAAEDPKVTALRGTRSLNPRPQTVHDEQFASSAFFDARDLAQVKYEMVRKVEQGGATVSAAAATFGLSRPTYYAAVGALTGGGLAGLAGAKPGPKRAHKLTDEVCAFCERVLVDTPGLSSAELARRVGGEFGVHVHPRSVERALARYREANGSSKSP